MEPVQTTQKLDERGRIQIPKTLRDLLDIKKGDFLTVKIKKIEPEKHSLKREETKKTET
ncbi:MAG: hypothetical protein ACETVN_04090 [Asgard group archaeon]